VACTAVAVCTPYVRLAAEDGADASTDDRVPIDDQEPDHVVGLRLPAGSARWGRIARDASITSIH
jgi:hypothetical protein